MRKFRDSTGKFHNCFAGDGSVSSFAETAVPRRTTIQPDMKRLSVLLAALPFLCLTPARAAVDAHSYVQKGLVACYDGIDNAGTGTHDATATTWADLSGNGFDGTLASNLGWAADG